MAALGGQPEQDEEDTPSSGSAPLIPDGQPLAKRAGSAALAGSLLLAVAVVVLPISARVAVPLGAFTACLVALSTLLLLGTFRDRPDAAYQTPASILRPGLATVGAAFAVWLALRLAVAGTFSQIVASLWVTGSVLALIASVGWLLGVIGVLEAGVPLHRRYGFLLCTAVTLLLLPTLGTRSLIDPWETHYGEVAREILARNDWISLWWAHEKWFMSKPILVFWLQAMAMATLGVAYEPGQMLAAAQSGAAPHPEWALRFPIFVFSLAAIYLLYRAVSSGFGKRAGLFAGLALATMPQWFFLTHQTMTDLPFVAAMSAALCFFMLGANSDAAAEVRTFGVSVAGRVMGLSARHLLLGSIVALTAPQLAYLVSRNFELNYDDHVGLRMPPLTVVTDTFVAGSPEVCGQLPGHPACEQMLSAYPKLAPALLALILVQALAALLYLCWGERRIRRLYFVAAYVAAALSIMAKGPAGLVLPALAVLAYLFVEKRFELLGELEIPAGMLVICSVALPWFVAAFVRHGPEFTDRLLFHDMVKRAFDHVHDTNDGDDTSFRYYVWQLGYAVFPWVALLPAALLGRVSKPLSVAERTVRLLALCWFAATFVLFSLMQTKFHHYIFPAVPALAVLVGVEAARLFDGEWLADDNRAFTARVLLLAGAALVFLVGRDLYVPREGQPDQARLLHLFTYNYERVWPASLDFSKALSLITWALVGAALLGLWKRTSRAAGAIWVGLAALFTAWALGAYLQGLAPHWGQRELVVRYHQSQPDAEGPLVAYQMNWKGENFYSGNRIAVLLDRGRDAKAFFTKERKRGVRTFYVVTSEGFSRSLRTDLGGEAEVVALTNEQDNNKFRLFRASYR